MKRKKNKKQFTGISAICIASIIFLNLMGVGYGHWNDGLNVDVNVITGNIDPKAYVVDYTSLSINTSKDGRTVEISGNIYKGTQENLRIKITNEGSIPVVLKGINTVKNSEIVSLNEMRYGLSTLEKKDIGEFELSISHEGDNYENIIQNIFAIDEISEEEPEEKSEEEDEIQKRIDTLFEEIKLIEDEINRLRIIENHEFKYDLSFIQGI